MTHQNLSQIEADLTRRPEPGYIHDWRKKRPDSTTLKSRPIQGILLKEHPLLNPLPDACQRISTVGNKSWTASNLTSLLIDPLIPHSLWVAFHRRYSSAVFAAINLPTYYRIPKIRNLTDLTPFTPIEQDLLLWENHNWHASFLLPIRVPS